MEATYSRFQVLKIDQFSGNPLTIITASEHLVKPVLSSRIEHLTEDLRDQISRNSRGELFLDLDPMLKGMVHPIVLKKRRVVLMG